MVGKYCKTIDIILKLKDKRERFVSRRNDYVYSVTAQKGIYSINLLKYKYREAMYTPFFKPLIAFIVTSPFKF